MSIFLNKSKVVALTGGEAAAEAMKQIEPGVVPVYPITPQTPIIESFIEFVASGKIRSEVITCESEHSVMSVSIGAASSGVRSMTATSSAGLALMYEMLGVASGMRLPIVMNIASRAISSPLNIHCDHSDVMGVREAGWIQIFSETAQEVYDHNFLALKIAENEKVHLPAMVVQDGFITSHLMERVEVVSDEDIKGFIGDYEYPFSLLSSKGKTTFGPLVLPQDFFEIKLDQALAMQSASEIFEKSARDLKKITGREYPKIETFQVDDKTEGVVIIMGGSAGTAKETAKELLRKGHRVGVIKIRLFRPFPYQELANVLENINNIAVLDRAFSFGSHPPLYSEVLGSLSKFSNETKNVASYIYGLGGRDLKKSDIKKVFADILTDKFEDKTNFLK